MFNPLYKLQVIFAAALLPAILFLTFPIGIIDANDHEISFTRSALYLSWILFSAGSAILIGATFLISKGKRRVFLAILASLAVNILVWNAVFPHFWFSTQAMMVLAVIVEILVFALCLLLALKTSPGFLLRLTSIFAALMIGTGAIQNALLWRSLPSGSAIASYQDEPSKPSNAGEHDFAGNVYHVVLDAFSSQYMTHQLASNGSEGLEGFTFYPRAISNYGRTYLSMRSVFSGKLHEPNFSDWKLGFSEGFSRDLRDKKIPLYYFPFYSEYCDPESVICRSTFDVYYKYKGSAGSNFLVDVIFQSALPVSLRNYLLGSLGTDGRPTETWDYGFSLSEWVRSISESTDSSHYPKWRWPIQSLTIDTLQDFLETEAELPATGRYVYLHLMAPHPPNTFAPNCSFIDPDVQAARPVIETYEDQFACALTMIQNVVSRLRELGRFEDSLIIFHADHSTYNLSHLARWDPSFKFDPSIKNLSRNSADLSLIPGQQIEGISSALLLVHRPGQETFDISSEEAQLIDIAPTILDFFDLDSSSYEGHSLVSPLPFPAREQVYYESSTPLLEELRRLAKFTKEQGKWVFDSWSLANGSPDSMAEGQAVHHSD